MFQLPSSSLVTTKLCSSVQWAAFLSVFIDHDAAHKYVDNIVCCFGCGWKGEIRENSKNCIIVKIVFFPHPTFLLQSYSENMGQKFSFSF
jgi:hypothetical protein